MLKYKEIQITCSEVPEQVSLCINITGCPVHCPDCHSKWLWEDIGEELEPTVLSNLIAKNEGISCIAFMGGDQSPHEVYNLAKWIKNNTELKVCWYSGEPLRPDIPLEWFDFVKTGPFKKDLGGLDSVTTNQRFYEVKKKHAYNSNEILYRYLEDVTYKFQKFSEIGDDQDDEE